MKVITPEESAGMLISFNEDSTASESVFNTPIKWKFKEADEASNRLAVLTLSTENAGGWSGYDYSIINRSDSMIDLKRSFDERLFQLVKSNAGGEEVTGFKKLIGIFDHSFLMPIASDAQSEVLKKYLPDWQPDQLPARILMRGSGYVCLLDGYSGASVAVFSPESEALLSFKNFEAAQGECSHSFSTITQNGVELILNEYQCTEGDPRITYYEVDEKGKLVAVNEATNEPSNQWAQLDSFRAFPGKWFPLFEGANGLERQQLCGDEGYVEIIETDNGVTWKELGYQDVWEAIIQNFEVTGVEVDVYHFMLKHELGMIREIKAVHDEAHADVMLFNGKPYTKQLELFPVNNNSNDCP